MAIKATREQAKKNMVVEQLTSIMAQETSEVLYHGEKLPFRLLSPIIEKYPHPFMSSRDQLIQAIDCIELPDFKPALAPRDQEEKLYGKDDDITEFTTRFSLNDGDYPAFKCLVNNCQKHPKILFSTNENPSIADSLLLRYDTSTRNTVSFYFECYDDGYLSNDPRIPSVVFAVALDLTRDVNNTIVSSKWNYDIIFNVAGDKRPKDIQLKEAYSSARDLMRMSCASLGITPSRLHNIISTRSSIC